MVVKLSICIPTYNFARFIPETLNSILAQDGASEVEIVVLDGASTDNTEDVVRTFSERWSQVRYIRLPVRGGIDRDFAKVVECASGQYCWMFSSDDTMSPGAIRRVLAEIELGLDVYICKHIECSFELIPKFEWPVLKCESDDTFKLMDQTSRQKYFSLAITSEAFFSFISGLIVNRATWLSVPLNEDFVGTYWAHVARLFELLQRGLSVKYLATALVNRRGENDSFVQHGMVHRLGIAVDGYNRLADTFFGHNSIEAFHIRRVLRRDIQLPALLYAKYLCFENPAQENRGTLDRIARLLYSDFSPRGLIEFWIFRLAPVHPWIVSLLRRLRQALRPSSPNLQLPRAGEAERP